MSPISILALGMNMEVTTVTVKSDLEKAIAQAQSALGSYATFAASTDDPIAKQMFKQMERDMKRHVEQLSGRLDYVNMNNQLNNQQQQQMQQMQQQQMEMKVDRPKLR